MAESIAGSKQRRANIKTGTGCINFRQRDGLSRVDLRVVNNSVLEHQPVNDQYQHA